MGWREGSWEGWKHLGAGPQGDKVASGGCVAKGISDIQLQGVLCAKNIALSITCRKCVTYALY